MTDMEQWLEDRELDILNGRQWTDAQRRRFLDVGRGATKLAREHYLPRGPSDAMEAHADAAAEKKLAAESPSPQALFLMDVSTELVRARKQYPFSTGAMVVLSKIVGDLARAVMKGKREDIYRSAVEVAGVAARVALEGDPSLNDYRRQYTGVDASPARGLRP